MNEIKLPQSAFTRYNKFESMGHESDTGYLSEKIRDYYRIILVPRFSSEVPEWIKENAKQKLDTLLHYDKILEKNIADKDTELLIKSLAKVN